MSDEPSKLNVFIEYEEHDGHSLETGFISVDVEIEPYSSGHDIELMMVMGDEKYYLTADATRDLAARLIKTINEIEDK